MPKSKPSETEKWVEGLRAERRTSKPAEPPPEVPDWRGELHDRPIKEGHGRPVRSVKYVPGCEQCDIDHDAPMCPVLPPEVPARFEEMVAREKNGYDEVPEPCPHKTLTNDAVGMGGQWRCDDCGAVASFRSRS